MSVKFNRVTVQETKLNSVEWDSDDCRIRRVYASKDFFAILNGCPVFKPNCDEVEGISQSAYGFYCTPDDLREIAQILNDFCDQLEEENG